MEERVDDTVHEHYFSQVRQNQSQVSGNWLVYVWTWVCYEYVSMCMCEYVSMYEYVNACVSMVCEYGLYENGMCEFARVCAYEWVCEYVNMSMWVCIWVCALVMSMIYVSHVDHLCVWKRVSMCAEYVTYEYGVYEWYVSMYEYVYEWVWCERVYVILV